MVKDSSVYLVHFRHRKLFSTAEKKVSHFQRSLGVCVDAQSSITLAYNLWDNWVGSLCELNIHEWGGGRSNVSI